ncbi:metallophosphoesterase family protein [Calothrix rhizosoleniae]|uniref:metallophosphoesterase family protein n=1 Tax=Calothrix rhizosoleniae TaxID=888997 RepID=UPI000B49B29B|nr:metallophosphoesterase family protein [Calothrix rhizosoleniae]
MTATKNRRIVIGDVHGYYEGLMTLLEAIAPNARDSVYFLGDLIDRGPQSFQVVELVRKNSYHCILGNHEQMLLNLFTNSQVSTSVVNAWLYSGGQATIASYPQANISQEHLEWFKSLPTHLDLGDIWLVHAGVNPSMSIEKQNSNQFCWVRDEFHSMQKPYFPNKQIIVGHTMTFTFPGVAPGKIVQGAGWLNIDTGAYHPRSGWLTGLDVTNNLVYQVNVFQNKLRTLPLEEAVTMLILDNPKLVGTRKYYR